ncbi:hypothetical protein BVG16_14345 [Paenibacillus selenitireducens]|uniref:Uncharacterized protein n=1 Tax=Paenibacillus selenitireducens TaxID=1324314 RepID=A0A1T2XCX5_9BACL|nr:hypothetical protein [Paenibacillus selenitireducens]OPA77622.1 hypothetical protein BVG16_14345 [Paenibacillus selenitireducens]
MDQPLWYIVILGVAAIVFAWIMPKQQKQNAIHQGEIVKEVEDTLEHFMDEIESDNKELVELVGQMKQDFMVQQNVLLHRVDQLEQRCQQFEFKQQQLEFDLARYQTLYSGPTHPVQAEMPVELADATAEQDEPILEEEIVEDTSIKARYVDVFALYEDGKSVDMISKKTGIPRGEVQLILQLSKQEAHRV